MAIKRILLTSDPGSEISLDSNLSNVKFEIDEFIKIRILEKEDFDLDSIKLFNPGIIIVSSKNSLYALSIIKDLICDFFSVFTLSEKLALAVKKIGIKRVQTAKESNIEGLAELINSTSESERILQLTGNLKVEQLSNLLSRKNVELQTLQTYKTELIPHSIDTDKYDGSVFASYSAVEAFFKDNSISNQQDVFSIGLKTSEYLSNFYSGEIVTASQPNWDILINEIISKYESSGIEN